MKNLKRWLGLPTAVIAMSAVAGPELGDVNVAQNIRVDVLGCLEKRPGTIYPLCIPADSPFNIHLLDDGDAITSSRPYSYNGYNAWNSAVSSETISPAIKKIKLANQVEMTTSAVSLLVNGHYRIDYKPNYGVQIPVAHSGRWALSLAVEQRASTGIKNSVAINASFVQLVEAGGLTLKAAAEEQPRIQFEKVSQLGPFVGIGGDLVAVQPIGGFGEKDERFRHGTVFYGEGAQTISFNISQNILLTGSSALNFGRQHYCWNNGMPAQLAVEGGAGQCPQSEEQSLEGIYITATLVDLDNLTDLDGDGIPNHEDDDMDGDGIPNEFDTDVEGDGFDNDIDNCPNEWNPSQEDRDGDGVGDICDVFPDDANESADNDGDGFGDNGDNCPLVSNVNQSDVDGDGIGDACDDDADNDGVLNAADNCPLHVNADQSDKDGDGIGDVCDGFPSTPSVFTPIVNPTNPNEPGAEDPSVPVVTDPVSGELVINGRLFHYYGHNKQDALGSAVIYGHDINGDGVNDFAIGAPLWDAPKSAIQKVRKDAGSVYIISGKDATVLKQLPGENAKDNFGQALAFADVNADGKLELIVGAPKYSAHGVKFAGRVYAYDTATWQVIAIVNGQSAGALLGSALLTVNDAVYAAAPQAMSNTGLKKAGAVLKLTADAGNLRAVETLYGQAASAAFGQVLAVSGDINSDGLADLAVGAPKNTPIDGVAAAVKATGSVYLFATGASTELVKRLDGKRAQDAFGSAIDADTDLNNDGIADLVVGAPLADVIAVNGKKLKDAGSVYALAGGTYAELAELKGSAVKQLFGQSVIAGVDTNKDDQLEILVGASGASAPNPLKPGKLLKNAGAVYGVDIASQTIVSTVFGVSAKAALGTSVQDAGDVDGDGYRDWLFATPKQTNPLAANNKKAAGAGLIQVVSGIAARK